MYTKKLLRCEETGIQPPNFNQKNKEIKNKKIKK